MTVFHGRDSIGGLSGSVMALRSVGRGGDFKVRPTVDRAHDGHGLKFTLEAQTYRVGPRSVVLLVARFGDLPYHSDRDCNWVYPKIF